MSRLDEYLRYHRISQVIGDIDPSYEMLRYVADRFELNIEQRYWLAFVYALTYCGASTFYVYNEFPDYENIDLGRMQRWWDGGGRERILCQTDRRWVRSNSLFVPAVKSYRNWLDGRTQAEHFDHLTLGCETPEARYDAIYTEAGRLVSFGQFALFLYLEALHTITPLDLAPTTLDLDKAWSCRNGLYYAYELDHLIDDTATPIRTGAHTVTYEAWHDLWPRVDSTIWQTETMLCAYRKYHRGKRYIGYYIDRQGVEIAKMADRVPEGVCWNVLWQYREETYHPDDLLECVEESSTMVRGLPQFWTDERKERTQQFLQEHR